MDSEWTILLYMNAPGAAGLANPANASIESVLSAKAHPSWNVLVEIQNDADAQRLRLRPGERAPEILERWPRIDVTARRTLTEFIDWGTTTFPSRNTALVLWGHGAGWENEVRKAAAGVAPRPAGNVVLIGADGKTYLSNRDVRRAIERSRVGRVDLYGFDACSMAALEVAYEVREVASVMVGCEWLQNPIGWPYAAIFESAAREPSMSARRLGEIVVERTNAQLTSGRTCALSLELVKSLADAVGAVGDALVAFIVADPDRPPVGAIGRLTALRAKAKAKSGVAYGQDVDLAWLVEELGRAAWTPAIRNACAEVEAAMKLACIAPARAGLSVYFPDTTTYFGGEAMLYGGLRMARKNGWAQLVALYLDFAPFVSPGGNA